MVRVAEPEELYRQPETRELSTFVGDADFFPGDVAAGVVSCELGILRTRSTLAGRTRIFGRDQVISVRLPVGRAIRARLESNARFACGDRVRIQVRHEEISVFLSTPV